MHNLDRFISPASVELIPVDREQGQLARSAFSRFGKGLNARDSTTAIVSRTQPPSVQESPCSAKATIFTHTDVPIFDVRNG